MNVYVSQVMDIRKVLDNVKVIIIIIFFKECEGNCLECDDYQTCTLCSIEKFRILDSNDKCVCDTSYYQDSNNLCQPCHFSCKTCDGDKPDNC